jgi:hypothetical protein
MTEPSADSGEPFKAQFRPLLFAQVAELGVAFGWLISFAALFVFLAELRGAGIAVGLVPALLALALASLAVDRWSQRTKRDFPCPRCHELFFDRKLLGWNNGARSPKWHRCQNCGLEKWPR